MTKPARVLLTTGGTGGHIFPALAVAEQLRLLEPDTALLFMGSTFGTEGRLATQAGIPFVGLPVQGVLGRGIKAVRALAAMGKAICQARAELRTFAPDVVAGFGAYASVPAIVAAKCSGVPTTVHEQNAMPGVSNRLLAKGARRIFLSLPDTGKHFDARRTLLVGNPVRGAIAALVDHLPSPQTGRPPRLLVMGGSQGAKAINSLMLAAANRFMNIEIWHQTGTDDEARVRAGYQARGLNARVEAFIDDMAEAYAWADAVLCRSGASTVAELALAGKPSVLVPFPFATHDHQTCNARALESAGGAVLLHERDLPHQDAAAVLLDLLHDTARLASMAQRARSCARPHAAEDVAKELLDLAHGRSGN